MTGRIMTEIANKPHFDQELLKAKKLLVVVDFHATWCGPCKQIAPLYAQLSEKYQKEAKFLKVDVDTVKEVAMEAGVKAMPSFGFYHQGQLLELVQGGQGLEDKIKALSAQHSKHAFSGAGHSMMGGSTIDPEGGAEASAAASALASDVRSAPKKRFNPWADKNFMPKAAAPQPAQPAQPPTRSEAGPKPHTPWSNPDFQPPLAAAAAPSEQKAAPAGAGEDAVASGDAGAGAGDATAAPHQPHQPSQPQASPGLVAQLREMGFTEAQASRALLVTGGHLDHALNWILEHGHEDLDEPMPAAPAQASGGAGGGAGAGAGGGGAGSRGSRLLGATPTLVDEASELDGDMADIVANMQKKAAGAGKASKQAGPEAAPAKKVGDMTSEEKMQWLDDKRQLARKAREQAAIERAKDSEKNRVSIVKAQQNAAEQQEKLSRDLAAVEARKKKKEKAAAAERKKKMRAQLALDKARRQKEYDQAIIDAKAAKTAAAAAHGK